MILQVDHRFPIDADDPRDPAERVPTIFFARQFGVRWQPPDAHAVGVHTEAFVNDSRWVANCPSCAGAELVSRRDPRFWCCSCNNVKSGGMWVKVVFPKHADDIETVLLERERPETRHWTPGQSVKDLRVENRKQGDL